MQVILDVSKIEINIKLQHGYIGYNSEISTNLNPYKFLYPYDPMNLAPKYATFCVQLVHTHAVLLT